MEAEIEQMNADMKVKKDKLKALKKTSSRLIRLLRKKAEEEKAKLLEAIKQSGKSYEEILELLKYNR